MSAPHVLLKLDADMYVVDVKPIEAFDSINRKMVRFKGGRLRFEHSLISLSKWEAKFKKPYLNDNGLNENETIYYFKCMCLDPNIDEWVFASLPIEAKQGLIAYINDPMTATTVNEHKRPSGRKEVITSELIYYWMIALEIPWECEKWHLNRLMTLIRVAGVKSSSGTKGSKMSNRDILKQQHALNASRRAKMNSKG